MSSFGTWLSNIAKSIFFDNSTNGFIAKDTQGAIEEVANRVAVSASPGFSWGRSGNSSAGTYLQNDTVPSNITGRLVPVSSGSITTVFVACDIDATFTIVVERRVGNTFTQIASVSVTASRKQTFSGLNVPVTLNDEICVKIGTGSAQNVVVGLIIRGSA